MCISGKGFWLLVLVSVCMVLSSWLPAHHKLWFVSETGHISHGQALNVVMILLLFARWKYARSLTLLVNGLQFLFGALILFTSWQWGHPWLGYGLTTALHLVVLKVLNDSASVRAFLEEKPAALPGQQAA